MFTEISRRAGVVVMPVISALSRLSGGSRVPGLPGLHSEALSQKLKQSWWRCSSGRVQGSEFNLQYCQKQKPGKIYMKC
jgi:hypothetical protein